MENYSIFVADIHGNLEALQAVMNSLENDDLLESADVYCLGDIVGYGPDPCECVETVRDWADECVLGNHDAAATGRLSTDWFNSMARESARWTRDRLGNEHLRYLKSLPEDIETDQFYCVHGSPEDPLREYITDEFRAEEILDEVQPAMLLTGHTHKPALFRGRSNMKQEPIEAARWIPIDPGTERFVLNPGSVGQPRDGNPNASYLVLDHESTRIRWERISYPFERTQEKIRSVGLPRRLADRLRIGS